MPALPERGRPSLLKRLSMLAGAAAGVLLLLMLVGAVLIALALRGHWPFPPLHEIHQTRKLDSHGTLSIHGLEDRGFGSNGYQVRCEYLPPGKTTPELVGEWIGPDAMPRAYPAGNLIVLIEPGGKKLHVRSPEGGWKWFAIHFPDEKSSLPVSHYATLTGLSEASLRSIRRELSEEEKTFSPNAAILDFDPGSRELAVAYRTTPDSTLTLILKLDPTGKQLSLDRMERATG